MSLIICTCMKYLTTFHRFLEVLNMYFLIKKKTKRMLQVVSSKTLVLPGHGRTTTLVQNLNLTNAYFEAKSDFHACFFSKNDVFHWTSFEKIWNLEKTTKKHHLLHEEIISLHFWDMYTYVPICINFFSRKSCTLFSIALVWFSE